VAVVAQADDTKAQNPDAMFQELVAKFRQTKNPKDQQKLFSDYSGKFLAMAEKNANKLPAVKALAYVLQIPSNNAKDSPQTKAKAALKKYADNKDAPKDVRAHAAKAMIKATENSMRMANAVKNNAQFRAQMEKAQGKEAVEKLLAGIETGNKEIKGYKDLLAGDLKGVFPDLSVGQPAPEVVSEDINGKPVKLSDLKGKVVVLDIWATWCPPCRGMIPHTRELVSKMKDKPFVFVSVSADAKKETLVNFMKDNSMPWTHWWTGTGGLVKDWEIEAYPTIFILDHKGVIREKIVGANSPAIDKAVTKLVAEAADKTKGKQ
jgi:thiol-disulfide isomerase/thioredoxin